MKVFTTIVRLKSLNGGTNLNTKYNSGITINLNKLRMMMCEIDPKTMRVVINKNLIISISFLRENRSWTPNIKMNSNA